MAYTKQVWADLPAKTSPFSASRMNHIENGISNNDTNKLDKTSVKTIKTTSDSDIYSCNYVNGIIESGSNDNGKWIKFNDGTMICSNRISVVAAINSAYGTLYRSDAVNIPDFPVEFIEKPSYSFSCDSTYSAFVVNWSATTKTNTGMIILVRIGSSTPTVDFNISYIAIGKWK